MKSGRHMHSVRPVRQIDQRAVEIKKEAGIFKQLRGGICRSRQAIEPSSGDGEKSVIPWRTFRQGLRFPSCLWDERLIHTVHLMRVPAGHPQASY
jgi:hypothetical protein